MTSDLLGASIVSGSVFFTTILRKPYTMRIPSSFRVLGAALALSLGAMGQAHAEADYVQNAPAVGTATATARVDFRVTVRQVLFFGVGTGATATILASSLSPTADNSTIDEIAFEVMPGITAAFGTPIAATSGGDLATPGDVSVRVFGNGGTITLGGSTPAAGLSDGLGNSFSFAEINTVPAGTAITPPTLVNGALAGITLAHTNQIVDLKEVWTYEYANTAAVTPGIYTGRVTYTAALP